eukprot:709322-Rhodomonas_salina.5
MLLRKCYAMCGTEIGYAATSLQQHSDSNGLPGLLSPYGTEIAYGSSSSLRSGTDLAYGPMRCVVLS